MCASLLYVYDESSYFVYTENEQYEGGFYELGFI